MNYNRVPVPVLETPRLILRPLELADAPRIQLLFPHYDLLRYMAAAIPWPYPADGALSFLHGVLPKMEAREEYHWAILDKARLEEGLIGSVGLMPASDSDHRGFWLAEEFWGQGLMSEANLAINDFAFGPLGMTEMILGNAEPNVGSHRLKEKAGAEIVRIEERQYVGGAFPGVVWRLTAEAWAKNRDRFLTA